MRRISIVAFSLVVFTSAHALQAKPTQAAIASAHPLATEAGYEILNKGGNAFDAAVAISAVLAVVEPQSSGLGGGGFWLLHEAKNGKNTMVDGRERAPLSSNSQMYQDKHGNVVPGLSFEGPLAAAIPGEPAALVHLAKHYGRLSLADDLAPAIRLAKDGFPVNKRYRMAAERRLDVLQRYPASAKVFLRDGKLPEIGTVIKQADLAKTLEVIAAKGHAGFYQGEFASKMVTAIRADRGIWSLQDMATYTAKERVPLRSFYRGALIISAPPPSSGGTTLATILNILSTFHLERLDSLSRLHLIVEAMRHAFWDRARFLGDTDFVKVPVSKLISQANATQHAKAIKLDRATASVDLGDTVTAGANGTDTTHFSIIDTSGNRVAATLSVNYLFGSGYVLPGTGLLLNNEMDDFSSKPGVPNIYGLVGSAANAIAPGKRPLSSMSPTFIETPDRIGILGTPGGSRIISMVLLAILDFVDGHGPESWVSLPRYHHQYLPDEIQYEKGGLTAEQVKALEFRGHKLKELGRTYGNMQAVLWDRKNGTVTAASDPRGDLYL